MAQISIDQLKILLGDMLINQRELEIRIAELISELERLKKLLAEKAHDQR